MPLTVTIVGLGPRGLGVLERLVTLAARHESPGTLLEVRVVDPTCTGAGVHALDQPDYLQMHGRAIGLTMFPDSASLAGEPDRAGPSLFEWAHRRGVRVPERPGCDVNRPVQPTDHLPRRLFGEYLHWFLGELVARADDRVRISFHRDVAVDAHEASDGRIVVRCRGGSEVASDFLFLTLGYGQAEGPIERAGPAPPLPFPLPGAAADVPAGAPVAVSGFGLTALDVVSCMTVGRGGSFRVRGADLEYVSSGMEPCIVLFSRSGVPARARPRQGVRPDHAPAVLTDELVRLLRSRGPGTLDFEADLLPSIETEMRVAYWRTHARGAHRSRVDGAVAAAGRRALPHLGAVLDALATEHGSVDMRALFTGEAGMSVRDSVSYERWVRAFIDADLEDASRYPGESPVKAALETIEDTFNTIRAVVGHGALTASSFEAFTTTHGPRLRRLAAGPVAERQAELLALMRAGVVRTPLGPDPEIVEGGPDGLTLRSRRLLEPAECRVVAVLPGHVRTPRLDGSGPDLVTNLRARGILRPHGTRDSASGVVDVDERMHPRDRQGRPNPRIWLLGPICEGVTFYTHVLPRPGARSDCVVDAHRAVTELLASDTGS